MKDISWKWPSESYIAPHGQESRDQEAGRGWAGGRGQGRSGCHRTEVTKKRYPKGDGVLRHGTCQASPTSPWNLHKLHTKHQWSGLHIGLICVLSAVGEKPQESKFRVNSKELTRGLIQIHKSFTRINLHTQAKWLLVLSSGWLGRNLHPPSTTSLFYRKLIVKAYGG